MKNAQPAALDGLTVLDLSRVMAGPWCCQMLADLGANVIKVEHPQQPDDTRLWGPPFFRGDAGEDAAYYLAANRNKSAMAVNFADPAGAELVRDIARKSDIVVENYKTGSLARYGLDYENLKMENPRIVYCSITGFGQTGPLAGRGGYDFLIQAMSGLMSVTGHPEDNQGPVKVGIPVADLMTGQFAATAILAAVVHRLKTGEGQHIDCALYDSQLAALSNQAMNYLVGGEVPRRLGNAHPNVIPYQDFQGANGRIVVAAGSDRQFRSVCKVLGLAELCDDQRFATNKARLENRELLVSILTAATVSRDVESLVDALNAAGVPAGCINDIGEAFSHQHVRERQIVRSMVRDDGREVPTVAFPARLSRTPASYRKPPPRFGEDTDHILRDFLGKDPRAIAELRARGVIA
ncbi:putative enzyme [Mesorhizobium plurifarium]|uniref:Putative enzyme n=1 Tax=Mesorhizobium plurifarium TaxID=69974 RepID=A0A090F181_MESPL|nr:putative enzyme [Mesorhizobium plurifarium]